MSIFIIDTKSTKDSNYFARKKNISLRRIKLTILFVLLVWTLLFAQVNSTDNNSITSQAVNKQFDEIPTTIDELNTLMTDLTSSQIKSEINIPFTGFIKNEGQKINSELIYYFSSHSSSIGFSTSTIHISQSIKPTQSRDSNNNFGKRFMDFDISFPGSQLVNPIGINKLTHSLNYFVDSMQLTNIESTQEVWYKDLYPNIDLRYYISLDGLKYDFIVHSEGDPKQIQMKISDQVHIGVESDNISFYVDENKLPLISDSSLMVYQNGLQPTEVSSKFIEISNNIYSFDISDFDTSRDLIIDPLFLGFSTYIGGNGLEQGRSIAVDDIGNTYVTGHTDSTDFLTLSPLMDDTGDTTSDVFITKLDNSGNLVYSTYLGGNGADKGYDIAVDDVGNAFVTGSTASDDFPTLNPMMDADSSIAEFNTDVFVTKLNSTGNGLVYSTYLSGGRGDEARGIGIDSAGNAYVTGWTASLDFPTVNPIMTMAGGFDIFVSKLNPTGSNLTYSTYLGGTGFEESWAIAVDSSGSAYVTGYTDSQDFPTLNPYLNDIGGTDIFVSKIDTNGSLDYSTYLGGDSSEYATGIAVDDLGFAYLTGYTRSSDFPLLNPHMNHPGDNRDNAFVTKLNNIGNGIAYSTYLGGDDSDKGFGIDVDSEGSAYVIGETSSEDFPTRYPTMSSFENIHSDVFVTKLNSIGDELVFSTNFGGESGDHGYSIAVDNNGSSYFTGYTAATDFPTLNPIMVEPGDNSYDAFVTKLIFDLSFPSITRPSDFSFELGSTGNIISWTVSDLDPDSYVLYQDGLQIKEGTWMSDVQIVENIDGLTVGSYDFKIVVSDLLGHSMSDNIIVNVYAPFTSPSSSTPTTSETVTTTPSITQTSSGSEQSNKDESRFFEFSSAWFTVALIALVWLRRTRSPRI